MILILRILTIVFFIAAMCITITLHQQYSHALCEYIDVDQVPKEYGGTSAYPLFQHQWEHDMSDHVKAVLAKAGSKMDATPA
jgi:hypothetical protein